MLLTWRRCESSRHRVTHIIGKFNAEFDINACRNSNTIGIEISKGTVSDATTSQHSPYLKINESVEITVIQVGVIATNHRRIDIVTMRPPQCRNKACDRTEDCQRIAMSNH